MLVLLFALGTGVFIEEAQGAARLVSLLVTALLFVTTIALFLFWTVLRLGLREGHLPRASGWAFWHDAASFLLLAVGAILGDLVLVRSLREAWLHARDARIGRVAIVRCPLIDDEAPAGAPVRFVTMELLPVSEEVWTVDGQPAWW